MGIVVGCAGWSLRKETAQYFPKSGTHLERYALGFNAVEINSSFYQSHRFSTYQRWAASTPDGFGFAVKLPKSITHDCRLKNADAQVEQFRIETHGLGDKLGPILIQLPPSLSFDDSIAEAFFRGMRAQFAGPIVCEPRHATWFKSDADLLLAEHGIGRVAADPSLLPNAAVPGGCRQVCYFRWHGSPRMYYSSYDERALRGLAELLLCATDRASNVWCIFDNTAEGSAIKNALLLAGLLRTALASTGDLSPNAEIGR